MTDVLIRADQQRGGRQNLKTASAPTIGDDITGRGINTLLCAVYIDVGCSLVYQHDPMHVDLFGSHCDLQ